MKNGKKQSTELAVTPQFVSQLPAAPTQSSAMTQLAEAATDSKSRQQLSCQRLLVGDTRLRALKEADEVLATIMGNTQVLATFGLDALAGVNDLNDQMMKNRPPVNIPELQEAMRNLSRQMRGIGKKYDPNDPNVLKKYENVRSGILKVFHFGKTFFDEFLADITSLQKLCDQVVETLEGKQFKLIRNVTYYDVFYKLNEDEIGKLIYKIAVMEMMRDLASKKAASIKVGDSSLGDRGSEEQARILEIVQLLENKIIAFKGRLWVAWAMAPQIRNMRAISVGLSARIDQTVGITIPTMKDTIVIWLTLSEAEQAQKFNAAVEETFNQVMTMFANATKVAVPALADALSSPAMDPRTIVAWTESLAAQADGIIQAIEIGQQRRAALEQAMMEGKQVIDASTNRVNKAQLDHALQAAAQAEEPEVQITRTVRGRKSTN